jgi:hypothetical protein
MKQTFTKLLGIASLAILLVGTEAKAQTLASAEPLHKVKKSDTTATVAATTTTATQADPDTAWHPQRRLWGYAFGDAYYAGHAPAITSPLGKENNYYETPTGRNAFQFRRIYLGYDYEITKKFKAEVLLASEPNENNAPTSSTSSVVNTDNLADGKMSFYIKNFNIRARDVWNGTDFVIGELSTPGFALNEPGTNGPTSLSETTWAYRSIERTITDFHKNNSYDVGAALQGTFDPKTKNFGYVLMIGDNTQANVNTVYNPNSAVSATNPQPNTGFFKIFYGDLWGKFLNQHLYVDLYADYAQTSSDIASTAVSSGTLGPLEHNMFKAFVAYTTPKFTVGVEAYTQNLNNAVIDNTTKTADAATVNAASFWVRGVLGKGWNYFARFDTYNPDTKFDATHSYTVSSNGYSSFDPTVKEQFYTFGLDYNPTKNVHFMPNIWLTRYFDQYSNTVSAYIPDNHTLIYRMTFFYTFGK